MRTATKNVAAARGHAGQAMVEFVVGLVALLLVAVGILSVAVLVGADTDSFAEAQEEAVRRSMGNGTPDSFSPVKDVDRGPDGILFTKDDKPVRGSFSGMRTRIAGRAIPADGSRPSGPDGAETRHDAISGFARGEEGGSLFSLRVGRGEAEAELPPAARPLLGLESPVTLRNEVWLPQTGGVP